MTTTTDDREHGGPEDDMARLCQACGMCCDGSLFGYVPLRPAEVSDARRRGLRIVRDGKGFEQPCHALTAVGRGAGAGRACAIYDHRPHTCRTFVCRLYERHRREGGPLEERMRSVQRVRALLSFLQSLRVDPDDFAAGRVRQRLGARADEAIEAHHELSDRLQEDFARA